MPVKGKTLISGDKGLSLGRCVRDLWGETLVKDKEEEARESEVTLHNSMEV